MNAPLNPAIDHLSQLARFRRVRQFSVDMVAPLDAEAMRLQPSADVSPPWWNLAHTSWFFARNVLREFGGDVTAEDEQYDYLLNSYYESLGPRLPRDQRGSVSRPTNAEVFEYRRSVDERMEQLLKTTERAAELAAVVEIGLQHEQQHQELFFTEIKYILAQNPPSLRKTYRPPLETERPISEQTTFPASFHEFEGGLLSFGHSGRAWCWDNELPVHQFYLQPFALADRLVTCGEYAQFIEDGGYRNPLLWLDNGWRQVKSEGWQAPLYWECNDGAWSLWTLGGEQAIDPSEPVAHVSFYEADAYARWLGETVGNLAGVRLPSEREWEHVAGNSRSVDSERAYLDSGRLHPFAQPSAGPETVNQMFGCLWQWTSSYYEPYPGYAPFPGALAEYNGKFMDNQRVLRGGSCVTPRDHFRPSYRNFWPAGTRFQFTGVRLALSL
jgi:ergothioneine biosynthesis protein EgtB